AQGEPAVEVHEQVLAPGLDVVDAGAERRAVADEAGRLEAGERVPGQRRPQPGGGLEEGVAFRHPVSLPGPPPRWAGRPPRPAAGTTRAGRRGRARAWSPSAPGRRCAPR